MAHASGSKKPSERLRKIVLSLSFGPMLLRALISPKRLRLRAKLFAPDTCALSQRAPKSAIARRRSFRWLASANSESKRAIAVQLAAERLANGIIKNCNLRRPVRVRFFDSQAKDYSLHRRRLQRNTFDLLHFRRRNSLSLSLGSDRVERMRS